MTKSIRHGMGAGKGSGYHNIIPPDPRVHSQSAKGMRQPQNIVIIPLIRKRAEEPNETAVRELLLFTENDGELYRQMLSPLEHSYQRKLDKGEYDKEKAIKGFLNVVNVSAKRYSKEFATPRDKIFTMADKREVARQLEEQFMSEIRVGNRFDADSKPNR